MNQNNIQVTYRKGNPGSKKKYSRLKNKINSCTQCTILIVLFYLCNTLNGLPQFIVNATTVVFLLKYTEQIMITITGTFNRLSKKV